MRCRGAVDPLARSCRCVSHAGGAVHRRHATLPLPGRWRCRCSGDDSITAAKWWSVRIFSTSSLGSAAPTAGGTRANHGGDSTDNLSAPPTSSSSSLSTDVLRTSQEDVVAGVGDGLAGPATRPPVSAELAVGSRGDRRRADPSRTRQTTTTSAASIGKSKHKPLGELKVKRRAPWGAPQLRDSWSEDAMSKRDRDNMDERICREYRYHPDEFRRQHIRYTALLLIPCILASVCVTYYWQTGRPIWQADPQHVLNLVRVLDTSPRSKLYAYRLEDTHDLPAHVLRRRAECAGQREYDERVFHVMHSAFKRPSPDELRLLEAVQQQQQEEADAAAPTESARE
ncbi:hypothetical protein NESM_000345000 [Novymonas esmeraldas]|uniref:Transmembrane protein n=1 Tax=Novymonas esmeraldas TaxID=1808958 RepID=A0AAW0EN08_9TRYP